ncbi:MAG: FecR family protein [Pseudobacter sp.]|uniref:FecR family protein n=1 Tax=Pseudobacter sp. TaxID=2045420 RepID=UPI003F7E50F7
MNKERLQYLAGQFVANQLTAEEQEEFYLILRQPEFEPAVLAAFEAAGGEVYASDDTDDSLLPLLQRATRADKPALNAQAPVHRIHFLRRWGWAAAVLLLLTAGTYFWRSGLKDKQPDTGIAQSKTDIAPGRDGAILTLADGRKVVLDSLGNGTIANENGTEVVLNNGQLLYADNEKGETGVQQYNTMQTPKGRQFNVTLPDGTRVWLNAASSITFPTAFDGNERRVLITGEAYFEVAGNKAKPFFVKIKDKAEVQVLGTSFNVNGYADEPRISTTLLEGSVRMNSNNSLSESSVMLKPGQQAQLENNGSKTLSVKQADIDKVMAWRYGAFNFEGASLQEVMRQLTRWYDIEVVYETGIPDIHFVGEMSRDISLAGVLKALEATNVHFRLENNRRLIVQP